MTEAREALAALEGISASYSDQIGVYRSAPPETLDAVLMSLGHAPGGDHAFTEALSAEHARRAGRVLPEYLIVEPGTVPQVVPPASWSLTDEEGSALEGRGPLPALALGRHCLKSGGETCWLLAAPPTLPLPARGWGVVVPLYALKGAEIGGLGDYEDLALAAEVLGRHGAAFLGINPVHAGFPSDRGAISPYSPSNRRRFAVMHLAAPGESAADPGPLIDYPSAISARLAALETAHARQADDPRFAAFVEQEGNALNRFATYEALAEVHGPTWDRWPAELRRPDTPEVLAFARAHGSRVGFHSWLQYLAEQQLSRVAVTAQNAGLAHGLYLDLAVGTHPHGAETWAEPEAFAFGVSLGAPPDAFSEAGQVWNVAPFNPRSLVATGFETLAATLRVQLRHAGMIRIDHILGFDRAFLVPDGLPGTYMAMPRAAMLAIVRIEAARAGAVIVGEDLGNIPKGLQDDLEASGILGTRVAMFEKARPPHDYPEPVLAAFGTHDLPPWAGWRSGRDLETRRDIGAMDTADHEWLTTERRADVACLDAILDGAPDQADAIHRHLSATPSRLVAVQIEDMLGVLDQPNLPGTIDSYPNWRRQLPVGVRDLASVDTLARTAAIMKAAGRAGGDRRGGV